MIRYGTFWKRISYKQLTPGRDSLSDAFDSELFAVKEAFDLQNQLNILFVYSRCPAWLFSGFRNSNSVSQKRRTDVLTPAM